MNKHRDVILALVIAILAWGSFLLGIHLQARKIDPADRHRGPEKWFVPTEEDRVESIQGFQTLPTNTHNKVDTSSSDNAYDTLPIQCKPDNSNERCS